MGIVTTIPESALGYVVYGDKNNVVTEYLQTQMQRVPEFFGQFSQRMRQAVESSYNYLSDSFVKMGLINQLSNQGYEMQEDFFQPLYSFEQLQNANHSMQRFVMSHPEVRQLYLDQNLDGYSDTYENVFGTGVGEQDYNVRRVMQGMVQDDGTHSFVHLFDEDLMEHDRHLEFREQVSILTTYQAIDLLLKDCPFDFTLKSEALVKINR